MAIESFSLDGLSLTTTPFEIADTPVFTPAPTRLDWVGGPDADGVVPVDVGHSDNATLTLPLRVRQQTTADLAWAQAGLLLAKLEATRISRDGLELLWSPKGATASWILTVRSADIAEMPMASRGDTLGYLTREPRFTIVFTCSPFLYRNGETIDFTEVTSTEPVFSITLADVPGHVDAEATITVTDNATQARRHVEWGLGEGTAGNLLIDSASLATSGFAGTATTRTGAYSANGVIRATLFTQTQGICGTGNLTHIGVHHAKARIWATGTEVRLRLAYRTADGPYSYTSWVAPIVTDDFCEVTLGTITIATVDHGAQQWNGRIEAYASTAAGRTLDIDYLEMVPVERYGKARGNFAYQAGLVVARDEFTTTTAGVALNARVAPTGGTWATSGAGTDFAAADGPLTGNETQKRLTTDGTTRYAILGSTNYASTEVGYRFQWTGSVTEAASYVIARWVASTDYAAASVTSSLGTTGFEKSLRVIVWVGGLVVALTPQTPATAPPTLITPGTWYQLRLIVYTSGRAIGMLLSDSGQILAQVETTHSSLATGGTLDDGKPGIADTGFSATRWYDEFYVATPTAEPFAINSSRALEIRHDSCERVSSDGLTYGKPASYTGGRAFVPCAGDADRTTRLWAKARRNDIDEASDGNVADSTKLDVALRPRYRLPTS